MELHWKTDEEWGNHLQLETEDINNEASLNAIAESMVSVFLSHRLTSYIRNIIKKDYYFTNTEEIDRILDLTQWIIEGEDNDSKQIKRGKNPNEILYSLFITNIKNVKVIHYDSIVKFRLSMYKICIQEYVGLAIDEFKQEEDHQAFIDMLRKYIAKQKVNYSEVHILQRNNFTFFNKQGELLTKLQLLKIIQKKPLYIVGLDIREFNLAPLIAMAPERIYIYGDNPSESKTLTVINIFEEKVHFKAYHHFPFPYPTHNLT